MTDTVIDGPGSRPWKSDTCSACRHLRQGSQTCAAFPDGIPPEIWQAWRGHRLPIDGDNGIQFEQMVAVGPYDIPEFLRKRP